jgi:hypothetical protein
MELYQSLIQFRDSDLSPIFVKEADDFNVVSVERVSKSYRGKSLVKLVFTEEEYREIFINNEDNEYRNNIDVINACENNYSGNLFVDDYWGDEEMKEGYVISYFDEENLKLFREIIRVVNPSLYEFDLNDASDAANFFYSRFDNESSEIAYEFTERYDQSLKKGCLDYVNNKLCGKLTKYGIIEKECGEIYLTTVDILLDFWDEVEAPHDASIMDVFKKFAEKNDLILDEDLYEDYYSYFSYDEFNIDDFNKTVNRILERLKERVLEDFDENQLSEYQKFYELFKKLGLKLKSWQKFPKEKSFGEKTNSIFKIIDFEGGKVIVHYSKTGNFGGSNVEKMVMSFEDFNNFLYHPELF